ncbi:TonB-dependent siderophore receptor [Neorhizobium petrolearium]|uniref:TonB-dependent siderophore receptor n=1 Tax=Neorhizobium petrolearium TaxID=515361 RepID=A0ABY8MAC5_9HYPH|nr:TonB-dependent siderophore receptor [Neorhizobium petrolearium]MCC2613970.1 TonB-dependent siderophore receptor [Neorhizobium petrolearium]WGI71491.1 TonB-dependent siderophore receptor [Neorhizobium petrolearium]
MKTEISRRSYQPRLFGRSAILSGCTALCALSPAVSLGQEADNSSSATTLAPIVLQGSGSASVLDTSDDSKSIVATQTIGVGKMPSDVLTTPASVSVITSKEIEERGANSVEQVLQYTAGVVTDYYGSDDRYDYFKIRGFSPFTYRDGLAIGRSWGGLLEEPYAYERVEVLKGANSTGFGVSDPGGSVNYVTKLPKKERFGEVYGTGGSFDHKEAGFDFGDNVTDDDTLSYRLTGKFQRSDAEYDHSQDDENFIMGGVTWRPTDMTSLSFVFDHLDRDGTPSSGGHPRFTDFDREKFFGEPDYNYNTANRNTYSVIFDHDFGSGLTFNASARYSKTDTGFGYAYIYDALGASDPADTMIDRSFFGSDKSTKQFIVDAHLLYETNLEDVESRTLLGVEYNKFDADNDTFYAAAPAIDWQNPVYSGGPGALAPYNTVKSNQKTQAIYFQEDLAFFDRLAVSVGLRNDWFDLKEVGNNAFTGPFSGESDISKFSKRLGVSYKITDELAAFASYAESVAPPSAGVEPTVGTQYEVGVKYRPDAFPALFSASVYDLTMENITTYEAPTYLPATIDKVRHRGVDLEAKVEVTSNVSLIAAYAYIDSKIEEPGNINGYNGKAFAQVPEHMASVWGSYTLEGDGNRGDMTFGLGARYIGSYYFDNANSRKSDGAIVFDAAFTYKIQENTAFQVNATNLFDEKHIANDDGGAYYYNPGRAIMATLRQTW